MYLWFMPDLLDTFPILANQKAMLFIYLTPLPVMIYAIYALLMDSATTMRVMQSEKSI